MTKRRISIVLPASIGVGVFLLWFFWQVLLNLFPQVPTNPSDANYWANRGTFGDSYGGLNTLFSGLAFFGVIYTIILQIGDKEGEEKERAIDKFERRFFHLVGLCNSYVAGLEETETDYNFNADVTNKSKIRGRAVIEKIYYDWSARLSSGKVDMSKVALDKLMEDYEFTFNRNETVLSPYFRTLYHTFRYIERSSIDDKKEYADIVRATLSGIELAMLGANALTERGAKFRKLIVDFNLLKHLPSERLLLVSKEEMITAIGDASVVY